MDIFTFTTGSHDSRTANLHTLALLTFAYTLIFTAYFCLLMLQSSINFEDGLGTVSMAVLYVMFAVSSLGTGPAMVIKFTPKWALMGAWFSHTLFICANLYPIWWTMIPVAVLLGLMAPVVWITQGVYFTALTRKYSLLTHQNLQMVMGRFSAVLDQVESISNLLGAGIAAGVLHYAPNRNGIPGNEVRDNITSTYINSSLPYTLNSSLHLGGPDYQDNSSCSSSSSSSSSHAPRDVSMCGPNHCPYLEEHTDVLVKPDQMLLYILLGILLGCNLLGILSTCFLTNIKTQGNETACQKYMGPVKLFANWKLYLIMWSFLQSSYSYAIYTSAFHQSFISCTLGVAMVGYTFMAVSVSRSLTAVVSGKLMKYVPRVYHYVLGCILSILLGLTWIFWDPQPDQVWLFFLLAVIFGVSRCLLRTHIRGLVVDVFYEQPKAGFAQNYFWYAVGSALAFGINNVLCLVIKAAILIILSLLACAAFISLEIILHFAKKSAVKEVEEQFEEEQKEHFMLHGETQMKRLSKNEIPERPEIEELVTNSQGVD